MLTASAVSENTFPGTMAWNCEATSNQCSNLIWAKRGEGFINVLSDSIERWGDYTGIQPLYSNPRTSWLSGSYGISTGQYRTWIAEVATNDTNATSVRVMPTSEARIFPIPAADRITVEYENPSTTVLHFHLMDLQGKEMWKVFEYAAQLGKQAFSFQLQDLSPGTYFMQAKTAEGKMVFNHKFIKQ